MLKPKYKIKEVLQLKPEGQNIHIFGWVKTFRNNQFISLSDGSCLNALQVVCKPELLTDTTLKKIQTGASLAVKGKLIESPAKGQKLEVLAQSVDILGESDAGSYPLQPKNHSLAFLREKAQWRSRTQLFHAVFKIRNELSFAVHYFFRSKDFLYWHTPILTASDCEGAGELFRVTNFDLRSVPKDKKGEVDDKQDFFGKATHLTVSGQLEGELGMMSFGNIYTFGPTFRAENSNTTRHLAEFWMIEPEMAFYDLDDTIKLATLFVKSLINHVFEHCLNELELLDQQYRKEQNLKPIRERSAFGLIDSLKMVIDNPFKRITYTEAINILLKSPHHKKKKFSYLVEWGSDLQSEHERYLVEKHFKAPVIITDYPSQIKAFYMRLNDDQKTVAATDILFPGIGEIIGGSQREERLNVLQQRMQKMDIDTSSIQWYLDTRRFGSIPHSGFGLGFERLIQFVTGMGNIRDVIPFPRYPNSIEF